MKQKIGIITYYLGEMPWYFFYFLHSCRYNPTIDFIIITDEEVKRKDTPANVFIIKKACMNLKS